MNFNNVKEDRSCLRVSYGTDKLAFVVVSIVLFAVLFSFDDALHKRVYIEKQELKAPGRVYQ